MYQRHKLLCSLVLLTIFTKALNAAVAGHPWTWLSGNGMGGITFGGCGCGGGEEVVGGGGRAGGCGCGGGGEVVGGGGRIGGGGCGCGDGSDDNSCNNGCTDGEGSGPSVTNYCKLVHRCLTAKFTYYVTLPGCVVSLTHKYTRYVPIGTKFVEFQEVVTSYVYPPARVDRITAKMTVFVTQPGIEVMQTTMYYYYETMKPQLVNNFHKITSMITFQAEKRTYVTSFTVYVSGRPKLEYFTIPYTHVVPQEGLRQQRVVELTRMVTADVQQRIKYIRLTYMQTEVVQPETLQRYVTIYVTEAPRMESYHIDYTRYTQSEAEAKEYSFEYTEYRTEAPQLKTYSIRFTYFSQGPLKYKEFSIMITKYITYAPQVESLMERIEVIQTGAPMKQMLTYQTCYYVTGSAVDQPFVVTFTDFYTPPSQLETLTKRYMRHVTRSLTPPVIVNVYTAFAKPEVQTETFVHSYTINVPSPGKIENVSVKFTYMVTSAARAINLKYEGVANLAPNDNKVSYTKEYTISSGDTPRKEQFCDTLTIMYTKEAISKECTIKIVAYRPKCTGPGCDQLESDQFYDSPI